MKNCLTILLVVFCLSTHAQSTSHFLHSNVLWLVADTYPNANQQNPNFVETRTYAYASVGDTVINGDNWKIILKASDSSLTSLPLIMGFVRKEGPRVYFMDTMLQRDTLYDFSLQVDDQFEFQLPGGAEMLRVKKIDTVQVNGDELKRFFFDEPATPTIFSEVREVWIENIGSLHGPLFPRYAMYTSTEIPDSTTLTCTFESTVGFYHNPFYENCVNNRILGTSELQNDSFSIYPNPTNGVVYLTSEYTFNYWLIDAHGRKQLSGAAQNKMDQIDLSDFQSGLYYLYLQQGEKISIKKINKL